MVPYGEIAGIAHALSRIEYQLKRLNDNFESFKKDTDKEMEFVDKCWNKNK